MGYSNQGECEKLLTSIEKGSIPFTPAKCSSKDNMTDYSEVMGHKYKGTWVRDMTLGELLEIPEADRKGLKFTDEQLKWLKILTSTNASLEEEQLDLAEQYEQERDR